MKIITIKRHFYFYTVVLPLSIFWVMAINHNGYAKTVNEIKCHCDITHDKNQNKSCSCSGSDLNGTTSINVAGWSLNTYVPLTCTGTAYLTDKTTRSVEFKGYDWSGHKGSYCAATWVAGDVATYSVLCGNASPWKQKVDITKIICR